MAWLKFNAKTLPGGGRAANFNRQPKTELRSQTGATDWTHLRWEAESPGGYRFLSPRAVSLSPPGACGVPPVAPAPTFGACAPGW